MAPTNEPGGKVPIVLSGQMMALASSPTLQYDIAISGVPFLLKPTQQDPYLRQVVAAEKDQFDSSREAGENSFGWWWLRSQSTWHGGYGQTYMDSSEEALRSRFDESSFVSVHTPGELTVAGTIGDVSGTWSGALMVTRSSVQYMVTMYTNSNKIRLFALPGMGTTDVTIGATGVPTAFATDGVNVFVAIDDKIYRVDATNTVTLIHSTDINFTATVALGYAKQRLILTIGPKVYDLEPLPAAPPDTSHTAHYTNPSSDYVYTAIAEGPNGIYLAGFSGTASDVASMSVTESAGTVVLGPPVVQLRLPLGEIARALTFYVGSLFALGTSNGVRVGAFTPYGQPELGRLLMDGHPGRSLTASGTLVYVGSNDSVWTVDLATALDQQGGYACSRLADAVGASGTDYVNGLVVNPGDPDLAYGATSTGRLLTQTTAQTVDGTLTTSWVRFDTTEPKRLHYVTLDGEFPDLGASEYPATVTVESSSGETRTFNVPGGTSGQVEFGLSGQMSTAQAYRLVITLRDNALGTLLRSWQMKARPAPRRLAEVVLPLMVADTITPAGGETRGFPGLAREQLSAIELLASSSSQVTVVDRLARTSFQAEIARFQFRQDQPPAHVNNLAGVLNVVLRLV